MVTKNTDLLQPWPASWRLSFATAVARAIHSGYKFRVFKGNDGRWQIKRTETKLF